MAELTRIDWRMIERVVATRRELWPTVAQIWPAVTSRTRWRSTVSTNDRRPGHTPSTNSPP